MNLLRKFPCSDRPRQLEFSRDGSRLLWTSIHDMASHLTDGTVESKTIKPLVAFAAAYLDTHRIVVATVNEEERKRALKIFDLRSGDTLASISTEDVRSLCVDSNRQRVITGSLDGNFGGYIDCYDFNLRHLSHIKSSEQPFDMVISDSGNHIAIASVFFELWDATGEPKPRFQDYPPDSDCYGYICEVNGVDITPDGRYALGGLYGGRAACFIVDIVSGKIIGWYGPDGKKKFVDTEAVALSADGQFVAVKIREKSTVEIYKVSDNTLTHQLNVDYCNTLAFSPVENILAVGGSTSISLWQVSG